MQSIDVGRRVTEQDLEVLPSPVARSLRHSRVVGTPIPHRVSVTQTGRLRRAADKPWMKFEAVETYGVADPSFQWTARLKVGGLSIGRAVDTLAEGRGRMHVRALGLFDIVDALGPEMDQGALLRWLNETMWFPHVWATGPIVWEDFDETSAIASLKINDTSVSAEFRFDRAGRFVDFRADRYRDAGGEFILTPWSTPISAYSVFDDIELPSQGAAIWAMPDHDLEYIRLVANTVTHIFYD